MRCDQFGLISLWQHALYNLPNCLYQNRMFILFWDFSSQGILRGFHFHMRFLSTHVLDLSYLIMLSHSEWLFQCFVVEVVSKASVGLHIFILEMWFLSRSSWTISHSSSLHLDKITLIFTISHHILPIHWVLIILYFQLLIKLLMKMLHKVLFVEKFHVQWILYKDVSHWTVT